MAASQQPTPVAVKMVSNSNAGIIGIASTDGVTWYHTIIAASTIQDTAKFTSPDSTDTTGMISRGKYTFVIRFALVTSDALAAEKELEKYIHGMSAASVNTEYGTPSDGIFASRPKIKVKITMVSRGWSTAHAAPSTVCAYCTLMSRHTR